jgi:hypothetical protein
MPEEVGKPIIAGNTQMEFTGRLLNTRKQIRSMKNPLDKCTIVSILPKEIDEVKVTIEPGKFHIEPGTLENPAILVVGSSSWWKDYDLEQPMLEIPHSSIQIADSVIKDYCNGMLGCDMESAVPGLFFVLGSLTSAEIKMKYKEKLVEVNEKQNNWYQVLVKLADSLWARSNGNPLVIWDEMRLAARSLNFNDKPWLKDFQITEMVRCQACGSMKNPVYPVCPACKAIDINNPLAKDLKFAV